MQDFFIEMHKVGIREAYFHTLWFIFGMFFTGIAGVIFCGLVYNEIRKLGIHSSYKKGTDL